MTTAPPAYKVAIDVVRQVLAFGREQGIPVDDVMAQYGFAIEALPGEPAYMSGPDVQEFLAVALTLLPDPLPGLYAAKGQLAALFGLSAFVLQTSSTVDSMLNTLIQLEPLIGNTGTTQIRHEPGEVHILWDSKFTDPYVRRHVSEFILSAYAWAVMSAAKPNIELIREVHFRHSAPEDQSLMSRYTEAFGCPAYFNQAECRIILPSSVLDLPLLGADPQLHQMLNLHAQKIMEERRRTSSLADQARACLHQLMHSGDASRENLAAALNMSGRTLHRKLREANTSYRELLDELRLERARMLLRESTLTVQQIAEHAGFDEHNSFTRWFRQLTNVAPSEYRQQFSAEDK